MMLIGLVLVLAVAIYGLQTLHVSRRAARAEQQASLDDRLSRRVRALRD